MYYVQAVNPNVLTALEANPKEHTMQKLKQLLDYADTLPDAILTYHASEVVL